MTTRVSCGEFCFPAIASQADRIAVVRALGFDLVDVALFSGDNGPLIADPEGVAAAIQLALQTQGLTVPDVFYATCETFDEIAPNPRDAALRDQRREGFAAAAEVTAQLGVRGMTILPGVSWAGDPDGAWACCVDELGSRVEQAARLGVKARIDAHAGSIAALPEQTLRLFEQVPGLRLTLDVSHFELRSVPLGRVLPLVPFASHMHVRAAKQGAIQIPRARQRDRLPDGARRADGDRVRRGVLRRVQADGQVAVRRTGRPVRERRDPQMAERASCRVMDDVLHWIRESLITFTRLKVHYLNFDGERIGWPSH
jgi:sugar phosphate isomerase/epimerase